MISLSARPPPPQGLVWLCMAIAKKCIDNHILLKGWNDLNCGRSRSSRRKYACLWSKGITASSLHWAANVGLDGKMSSFNSSSTHWARWSTSLLSSWRNMLFMFAMMLFMSLSAWRSCASSWGGASPDQPPMLHGRCLGCQLPVCRWTC